MERVTRAFSHIAARVVKVSGGYLAINAVMLLAEVRWHLISRLTIWDVSEMHRFLVLLGQQLHS
jgi:hypothetical protein